MDIKEDFVERKKTIILWEKTEFIILESKQNKKSWKIYH